MSTAVAQDRAPLLDVQRFDPVPQGSSFTMVRDGDLSSQGTFGIGLASDWSYGAFRYPGPYGSLHTAVESLIGFNLTAHARPARWVSVGVQVPFLQVQPAAGRTSEAMHAIGGSGGAVGLGDVAVSAAFAAVRGDEYQPFSVTLGPRIVLPTGTRSQLVGSGAVGLGGEVAVAMRWSAIHTSAMLGYQAQTASDRVADVYADDELRYGFAVGLPFARDRWEAQLEWAGGAVLTRASMEAVVGWDGLRHAPMEAMLSFQHHPEGSAGWVRMGASAGLTPAFGSPDVRVFAAFGVQSREASRRPQPVRVVDTDGDGWPDMGDACPTRPEDLDGVADEDGCPDGDEDLDGVSDAVDECPRLKEDRDAFHDGDGCPDPDNDNDAIPDERDGPLDAAGHITLGPSGNGACADDPETYNGVKDQDGCPDVGATLASVEPIARVFFDTNESALDAGDMGILDRALGQISGRVGGGSVRIEVRGHADWRGESGSNSRLSAARASAVKRYLVSRGVDSSRITLRALGESQPLVSGGSTDDGLAMNRRVEVLIVTVGRP